MAVLRALHQGNPGQCFSLEGESVILGRHPDCDIVLESASVSRQHARIIQLGGNHYIEDLHSRNGTFVNSRLLADRQLLHENDVVDVCDLTFVFLPQPPRLVTPPEQPEDDTAATSEVVFDDGQPPYSSMIMSKVDVSSGSSQLRIEANTAAKLKALIEIGRSLGRALELGEVLPKLLEGLFAIFIQADRGFVVLVDPSTGRLVPKAVKHRNLDDRQTVRVSRTIVNNVITNKEAILSADAAVDARFDLAESIVDFHIRSMMCVPLIGNEGDVLGAIQIDSLDQRNRFSQEDLDVLVSVACQAAIAVENAQLHETAIREQALARELTLAHEVQRGLLPAGPPRIERYEFFDFYEPASKLGGDYFDYVPLPDGRLAVVVADVSGKGISASLLMAKLSAEARFCLATEGSPAAAMVRLNQIFCANRWEDRFVTLVTCVLDPVGHEVTIVNAGHMPPLLRHASAQIETIAEEEARLPLGVARDVDYPQRTVSLAPGDCVVLYTDGITEAMNPSDELYGQGRLWTRLGHDADHVVTIGRGILDDVKQFVGTRPQSDDMCLTCFGREDGGEKEGSRMKDQG